MAHMTNTIENIITVILKFSEPGGLNCLFLTSKKTHINKKKLKEEEERERERERERESNNYF